MAIQVRCPHCQESYRLSESQRGKNLRCRGCKQTFVAREEEDAPVLEEASAEELRRQPSSRRSAPLEEVEELPVLDEADVREDRRIRSRPTPPPAARRRAVDDAEEEKEEEEAASKGGGGGVLIILGVCVVIFLLLGAGGGAAWYFATRTAKPDDKGQAVVTPPGDDRDKGGIVKPPDNPPGGGNTDGGRPDTDRLKPPTPPAQEIKDVAGALAALQEFDPARRRDALIFLSRAPVDPVRRDDVSRALNSLLTDRATRGEALAAARRWATRENVAALTTILDEFAVPFAQWNTALEVLGGIDDDAAAQVLARQLAVAGRGVPARNALVKMGKRAEKYVLERLNDPDPEVRRNVELVLKAYGTSDSAILERIATDLESQNNRTRERALEALARRKPDKDAQERVARALEGLLKDRNSKIKKLAMKALVEWHTPETVDPAIAALADKDLLEGAVTILGKLKNEKAIQPLGLCLLSPQQDRIAEILISFGQKAEGITRLQLAQNKNPTVRRKACQILAEIGTKGSLPVLRLAARTDILNADAAKEAIDRITEREKKKAEKEKAEKDKGKDKDK